MTAAGPGAAQDPFAGASLGPVRLRNRFVKAATFEGMTERGLATDGLVEFHRTVAAGGVGMSTVAYCAVSREGRGAPNQIVVREEAVPGLRRVVDAIHEEGAAAAVQLGHAGPVGAAAGSPGLSPSPMLSLVAMRRTRAATEADLTQVIRDFDRAAALVVEAGFDSIELHFGHHYLVSAFHSPRWNRRKDDWGGSVENRARLGRQIARSVRATVGRSVAVTAKLNMDDGVKGGLGVEEAVAIGRLLQEDGALDALELTGGGSFANPMYLFRGEAPIRELAAAMPKAIGLGMRVFGKRFLPSYPYEEAYFLPQARRFRAELDLPLILLGGISRLKTVRTAMAEGFQLVAMARALLREPGLVDSWRAGRAGDSACDHSNRCMATIYGGTHCVLVPEGERPGLSR
jgi:2,4-dienoyl-CoA reductase-like NADH-dependent reductase (Old Yellow Enzyme family)